MRRRKFISLVGGAASWPFATRAQQSDRIRRIVVLINQPADDPEGRARLAAFVQALEQLGWKEGRNARIDSRLGPVSADRLRVLALEVVALAPDVILVEGGTAVRAFEQATSTVPIVFVATTDPVGGGMVESLARPGGNATGFTQFEYGLSTKWLEMLKQIAPQLKRVAVIRDPTSAGGGAQFGAIQGAAASLGVEVTPIDSRDAGRIERSVAAFARGPNGGLIVASSRYATVHRELIIGLAARLRLPATYPFRFYVASGGLVSYGPDLIDECRRAAGYVDRILRGTKPADLPVQAATKYELVINLKTAKALGLPIPEAVLLQATEVIE